MTTLTEALLEAHDILATADIPHALCGGIAANLYREDVRATMDVDFYVAIGAPGLVALSRRFEEAGWTAQPYWAKGELLRLDRAGSPRVDCLIASTDYERAALERAVHASIAGREVPVLAAEDLIVFKLVAGRARDYEAVAAILNARGDELDIRYITEVLDRIGHTDRWARAKEEAALEAEGP